MFAGVPKTRQKWGFWENFGGIWTINGRGILCEFGGGAGRGGDLSCWQIWGCGFISGWELSGMGAESAARERVSKVRKGQKKCEKLGESWVVFHRN